MKIIAFHISSMVVLFFILSVSSFAEVNYSSSAHGGDGITAHDGYIGNGVLRDAFETTYAMGNCAHCHEQHASIDGDEPEPISPEGASGFLLLSDALPVSPTVGTYSDTETACLTCHGGSENLNTITNNNYSATFGGAVTADASSIMAALNLGAGSLTGSYHNLNDINTLVSGNIGFDVPSGATPCSACHNPHLAKANSNSSNIGNPLFTALSRPTDHYELYGDDLDERMPSSYQPPNRVGGGLEPDGGFDAATQAAKTPNYNTFCIDCHNISNDEIWSDALGRNLRAFDWSLEQHGGGSAANNRPTQAEVVSPFLDTSLGTYSLSCLDCHEPHGSSNIYLIRTSVNGNSVMLTNSENQWDNLCSCCHVASDANALQNIHHEYQNVLDCIECHFCVNNQGNCINNSDPKLRDCSLCHFHGASKDIYKTF